jgi:hypothetical protein
LQLGSLGSHTSVGASEQIDDVLCHSQSFSVRLFSYSRNRYLLQEHAMTRKPLHKPVSRVAVLAIDNTRSERFEVLLAALALAAVLTWMFFLSGNAWGVTTSFTAAGGVGTYNWSSPSTWVENPSTPDGDDDITLSVIDKTVVYDAAAVEMGGFGANSIPIIAFTTLRLDKNLAVTGNASVGRAGTLNLNGKQMSVGGDLTFGSTMGVASLVNTGPLIVTGQFNVDINDNEPIVLNGDDSLGSLRIRLATGVAIEGDVPVAGNIDMLRIATITFNNASRLSAASASLGNFQGYGRINGFAGSTLDLSGNLTISNIAEGEASYLGMNQLLNDTQGLTLELDGTLNLGASGQIRLAFDDSTTGGALTGNPANFDWAFRWLGNHETQLEGLFGTQLIVSTGAAPVTFNPADNIFFASDGYTYVGFATASEAVPEPSTWALAALGLVGLAGWKWRKRSKQEV